MPPPLAEVHSPLGPRHSLASSRQPSLLASLGFLSPVAALHMEHAMLTSALAMGARRWGAPSEGFACVPCTRGLCCSLAPALLPDSLL